MNFIEKLAIRLSITKAEIYMVSILLGFLMLGVIMKQIHSVENADILIKKAEAARYSDAEVDSLISLAAKEEAKVNDEVLGEAAAEEKGGVVEKKNETPLTREKSIQRNTIF